VRDGPVAVPIFERLERELATMRQTLDTVERAKRLQASYSGPATRRAIAPPDSEQQLAQIQNLVTGNVKLPPHVERTHRNGIFSFSFRVGRGARVPLPNDPTTSEFRAAYSAALVEAIAMENDSDE
jgi:hypothetical protein